VTVNVGSVNDAPVAINDSVSTDEDTAIVLGISDLVTPNDTDLDGEYAGYLRSFQSDQWNRRPQPRRHRHLYPDANFNGTATFDYTISDGNGGTDTATVTVNVSSVNDVPDAIDDSALHR